MKNTDIIKYSKYAAKLLGNTAAQPTNAANEILQITALPVPLKYFSNFWRLLEIPLINCTAELKLKWRKYCVLCS